MGSQHPKANGIKETIIADAITADEKPTAVAGEYSSGYINIGSVAKFR